MLLQQTTPTTAPIGGETTVSGGQTVVLDPEQMRVLVEHGQANTFVILMFLGVAVLCLGGLVFIHAVGGGDSMPEPYSGAWALTGALSFMFAGWIVYVPIWVISYFSLK